MSLKSFKEEIIQTSDSWGVSFAAAQIGSGVRYHLLEKTELWVQPVQLCDVDLEACAQAAARALDLRPGEIMVTDAIANRLTFDILIPTIDSGQIVAREKALLKELSRVPGLSVTDHTEAHSDGILGLISLDEEEGRRTVDRSQAMGMGIHNRIKKRAIIFSTGTEVSTGQIRDTNTPFLVRAFIREGYQVAKGPTLEDEISLIARTLRRAAGEGYGVAVTTGGIGAEGKDRTLEALQTIDPDASLPYVLKFEPGNGRHQKDGVRIGVGTLGATLIISLPGPHDEVRLAWPVLNRGLKLNWDKWELAANLAAALREKFMARTTTAHPGFDQGISEGVKNGVE
jgi:molybdenum cofactor synthesis domain-containing protein